MKQMLITLGPGSGAHSDIHHLLLEQLPAAKIRHIGLFADMSPQAIEQQFAPQQHEETLTMRLDDSNHLTLSRPRLEALIQRKITELEAAGAETILLLCNSDTLDLSARVAVVLEPDRLVPPLVAAIVAGHQVGIVLSNASRLPHQQGKWRNLSHPPCFAVADPCAAGDDALFDAALSLQEQGADVLVLDCFGYHAQHRDFLQKLLGIPVLLSNALVVQLAAELLV